MCCSRAKSLLGELRERANALIVLRKWTAKKLVLSNFTMNRVHNAGLSNSFQIRVSPDLKLLWTEKNFLIFLAGLARAWSAFNFKTKSNRYQSNHLSKLINFCGCPRYAARKIAILCWTNKIPNANPKRDLNFEIPKVSMWLLKRTIWMALSSECNCQLLITIRVWLARIVEMIHFLGKITCQMIGTARC